MLSASLLTASISFSLLFLMQCLSHRIDASTKSSMMISLLPSSFLDIYRLSISSLRSKVLCIVVYFFIFWSTSLMVSLFNGISTLFRLFNAKAILLEEQLWYYLTHSWEDKGVHTFPKGIFPKVNVIARLEYELAYYGSAVHRFNHHTTMTPPTSLSYSRVHLRMVQIIFQRTLPMDLFLL